MQRRTRLEILIALLALAGGLTSCGGGMSDPAALAGLGSTDQRLRAEAVGHLVQRGEAVAPAVEEILRTGTSLERQEAVGVLARIRPGNSSTWDVLAGLLTEEDQELRLRAALHLAEHGDARGREVLEAHLSHGDHRTRRQVIRLLGRIGNPGTAQMLAARLAQEDDPAVLQALRQAQREIESR